MKECKPRTIGLLIAVTLAACGDDPVTPSSCEEDTGTVSVTVTGGPPVAFEWDPPCPVALLLVEEDASDQWAIGTDEETWTDPDQANRIEPPVSYGVAPPGVATGQDPLPLTAGVTYELVLWRILPAGSAAPCLQRFDSACLLAVHPFTP